MDGRRFARTWGWNWTGIFRLLLTRVMLVKMLMMMDGYDGTDAVEDIDAWLVLLISMRRH